MNNKSKITKYKDYWQDDKGNISFFSTFGSESKALEALQSLSACRGCMNCEDCTGCVDCVACLECSRCASRTRCRGFEEKDIPVWAVVVELNMDK